VRRTSVGDLPVRRKKRKREGKWIGSSWGWGGLVRDKRRTTGVVRGRNIREKGGPWLGGGQKRRASVKLTILGDRGRVRKKKGI